MRKENFQDVTQQHWRGMNIGAVGFMIALFGFVLGTYLKFKAPLSLSLVMWPPNERFVMTRLRSALSKVIG